MAIGDIVTDISSLRSSGDTLFPSGTKIFKCLFYGVYFSAQSKFLQLRASDDSSTMKLNDGTNGAMGSLVGSTSTTDGFTAAMVPLFLSATVGMRLDGTPDADHMVNVTYIEVAT